MAFDAEFSAHLKIIRKNWETTPRLTLADYIIRGVRPSKAVWVRWAPKNRKWLANNFPGIDIPAGPERRKRTRRTAAPREAAIWPQNEFKGVSDRKQRSIIKTIAMRLGRAIQEGLLDPPKKPERVPYDPFLLAVERARAVRELVGRVDISGDSDGASWAKIVTGPRGRELQVYYRHGREVLAQLLAAAQAALSAVGAKIRSMWMRIERARQHGSSAWVAIIPLIGESQRQPLRR